MPSWKTCLMGFGVLLPCSLLLFNFILLTWIKYIQVSEYWDLCTCNVNIFLCSDLKMTTKTKYYNARLQIIAYWREKVKRIINRAKESRWSSKMMSIKPQSINHHQFSTGFALMPAQTITESPLYVVNSFQNIELSKSFSLSSPNSFPAIW